MEHCDSRHALSSKRDRRDMNKRGEDNTLYTNRIPHHGDVPDLDNNNYSEASYEATSGGHDSGSIRFFKVLR